jgi:hypothetical protein
MKVAFHANVIDEDTRAIADALDPVLKKLAQSLDGEYGGPMEHLWIQIEMLAYLARPDGRARHPFRFQKRVSGRSRLGLPPNPDWLNVGHFSVRPDFANLISPPVEDGVRHVLQRIHAASAVLLEKQKKLGGFDAGLFRERILVNCSSLGYPLSPEAH